MRPTSPVPPRVSSPLSPQLFRRLDEFCREPGLLAHLYWRGNYSYFVRSCDAHIQGAPWRLKATPHHGVGKTDRPTLNFLVADTEWPERYATAAGQREFHHGILLRRAALECLVDRPRYELADVDPKYPRPDVERDKYWQYDICVFRSTWAPVLPGIWAGIPGHLGASERSDGVECVRGGRCGGGLVNRWVMEFSGWWA